MIKDRRKQWQKECINFRWSRCGTVATWRPKKERAARISKFLATEYQTLFVWADEKEAA
jgi:hypothetical protein